MCLLLPQTIFSPHPVKEKESLYEVRRMTGWTTQEVIVGVKKINILLWKGSRNEPKFFFV
jgi:secreted protein with Ig-like and vWFA domain